MCTGITFLYGDLLWVVVGIDHGGRILLYVLMVQGVVWAEFVLWRFNLWRVRHQEKLSVLVWAVIIDRAYHTLSLVELGSSRHDLIPVVGDGMLRTFDDLVLYVPVPLCFSTVHFIANLIRTTDHTGMLLTIQLINFSLTLNIIHDHF